MILSRRTYRRWSTEEPYRAWCKPVDTPEASVFVETLSRKVWRPGSKSTVGGRFLLLIISVVENEYAETIRYYSCYLAGYGYRFLFEYDANKVDLLNAVNEETLVKVIRNGRVQEIPRKDVVVGDVIILETGEEILLTVNCWKPFPASKRIQSTGEPVITKLPWKPISMKKPLMLPIVCCAVQRCSRRAWVMRVESVGDATEIGKSGSPEYGTKYRAYPLNIQLTKLANLIGKSVSR